MTSRFRDRTIQIHFYNEQKTSFVRKTSWKRVTTDCVISHRHNTLEIASCFYKICSDMSRQIRLNCNVIRAQIGMGSLSAIRQDTRKVHYSRRQLATRACLATRQHRSCGAIEREEPSGSSDRLGTWPGQIPDRHDN